MKYRVLRHDELEELQQEFVRFLASNGIPAEEWVSMKADNPEKVRTFIEEFSDMVFDRILPSVEFLERREKSSLQIFKFSETGVDMVGLRVEGSSSLDFREQGERPDEMMAKLRLSGAKLQLMKAEKQYRTSREREVFELMEAGCLILKDNTLYTTLKSLTEQPE